MFNTAFEKFNKILHSKNALAVNRPRIFYYDEKYKPERRKEKKRSLTDYQPKSGTRLAFEYAKSKNKTIINIFKAK